MRIKKIYDLIKQMHLDDGIHRLAECDVLFFCHDVDRSVTLGKKSYSPLLDSVREYFEGRGLKCISIAHPFSTLTNKRGYGDPISINRSYLLDLTLKKLVPNEVSKMVGGFYGLYEKILRKTKAKLIITIGAPAELCTAARQSGCICVELLHGFTHTTLPESWGAIDPNRLTLPHGILSLSDFSANTFTPLTEYGIEVKTIPHPFLKRFTSHQLSSLPKEWVLPKVDLGRFEKEILVSLMWGYAGDHGPNIALANILDNGLFYKELSEVVAETKNIFWRFRFHPVQLRETKYECLRRYMDEFVAQNPNSEWRKSSTLPFPSVAMVCAGNISMASGSCYDAASVGLRSLMLCPTLQVGGVHEDYFPDLVQEGYVVKRAVSKNRILSWVNGVEKMQPRLSNLNDEQAWKDAVAWMLTSSGLGPSVSSGNV